MSMAPKSCRVCGCTDDHACPGGCAWVRRAKPPLCTACAGTAEDLAYAMKRIVAVISKDGVSLYAAVSMGRAALKRFKAARTPF